MGLHDVLQLLDEILALVTAVVALVAMQRVSQQTWRVPFDRHARRAGFASIAAVSFWHALSPAWLPEIIEQAVFVAFLLLLISSPEPDHIQSAEQHRRAHDRAD